jgi:rhamnosyl/mannosyltransferase
VKVLHVFKDYFPPTRGGIELLIHECVHSMDNVEFEVLTSSRSRRGSVDNDAGVRVVRAPEYARPTSTPVTPQWAGILRATDADVIHFHMPNPFGELMLLASRTQVPIVESYHADIVGRRGVLPLYLPFQQRAMARARKIIVASPPMSRAPRVAPHRDRTVVIPYGVDPERWRARPPAADEISEKYGSRIVLFLGRLAYYKGIDLLIKAMEGVDATLLVVGDGPQRAALEKQGDERRSGRIAFIGEVDDEDRAAYFHAADVFALPSTQRAEAFGIVLLEAMASGTPVISTELGTGTSWVNVHGQTGLVVPPGDPSALRAAMEELLDDPARAVRMGEAGAQRVAEHFARQTMLTAWADLYRSVLV